MTNRPIIVHGLEDAKTAIAVAAQLGCPVTLRSAPGAAAYLGPQVFRDMIEESTVGHGGMIVEAVFDCGDDPGLALAALRQGLKVVRIEAPREIFEKIADIAEAGLEVRFAYADELARKYQRDRAAGREELFLWQRWLRDILLVQQGHGGEIAHLSWRETLERQAAALTPAETVRWAHRLTETVEALDRNVNGRLALEVLMLDTPELAGASH